ncbi:MAG: hypothetical protein AAF399_15700, partial [Bacteroidota bacterium]
PTASPAEHAKLKRKPLPKKADQAGTSTPRPAKAPTSDNGRAGRRVLLEKLVQKLNEEETWRLHPPKGQRP